MAKPPPDRTAEVLVAALELIEVGWCQGKLSDDDGNYCAIGAVDRAHKLLGIPFSRARSTLDNVVRQLSDARSTAEYNDITDLESVRLAFKHAISEAET